MTTRERPLRVLVLTNIYPPHHYGGYELACQAVVERWRAECAVTALTPFGNPVEGPGSYADSSGAAPPPPSRATTVRWHPWHLGGRPKRRRGTR